MFDWLTALLYECWQYSQRQLVEEMTFNPWLVVDRSFGEWLADVDLLSFYNGLSSPYVGYRHMLPDGYYWHCIRAERFLK